jgi:hypothetical protein
MIQVRAISDYHNGYIRVVDMWPRAQIQLASVRSALIDKPPPEDTGRYSNEGVAATEGLVKGASIRYAPIRWPAGPSRPGNTCLSDHTLG